jgi:hypothetical protein
MSDPKDDDPTENASPVCYLPQADDAYAGYLAPAAVTALLRRWIALAGEPRLAAGLTALLAAQPGGAEAADATSGTGPAAEAIDRAQLRGEISASLPKIRDDRLHRQLRDLLDTL